MKDVINMKENKRSIQVEELDKDMTINKAKTNGMKWYDPREYPLQLNGFGWDEPKKIYRRLPKKEGTEISEIGRAHV